MIESEMQRKFFYIYIEEEFKVRIIFTSEYLVARCLQYARVIFYHRVAVAQLAVRRHWVHFHLDCSFPGLSFVTPGKTWDDLADTYCYLRSLLPSAKVAFLG